MSKKSCRSGMTLIAVVLVLACITGWAEKAKPTGETAPKEKKTTTAKTSEDKTKPELIDLNSATLEQLIQITGIGDVWARKIIDNRPYKSKTELKSRQILPSGTYNKIAKKVTVK